MARSGAKKSFGFGAGSDPRQFESTLHVLLMRRRCLLHEPGLETLVKTSCRGAADPPAL